MKTSWVALHTSVLSRTAPMSSLWASSTDTSPREMDIQDQTLQPRAMRMFSPAQVMEGRTPLPTTTCIRLVPRSQMELQAVSRLGRRSCCLWEESLLVVRHISLPARLMESTWRTSCGELLVQPMRPGPDHVLLTTTALSMLLMDSISISKPSPLVCDILLSVK